MPDDPTRALVSMGNYIFTRHQLVDALLDDARRSTDHDFGRSIIPEIVATGRVFAYDFQENEVPGVKPYEEPGYWRDVGTIESYWECAHGLARRVAALRPGQPPAGPSRRVPIPGPPARFIGGDVDNSLIAEGSPHQARHHPQLDPRPQRVGERGRAHRGLHRHGLHLGGQGRPIRRAIIDRYNIIPADHEIGLDPGQDRLRFHVDPSGLVVVPRGGRREYPARPRGAVVSPVALRHHPRPLLPAAPREPLARDGRGAGLRRPRPRLERADHRGVLRAQHRRPASVRGQPHHRDRQQLREDLLQRGPHPDGLAGPAPAPMSTRSIVEADRISRQARGHGNAIAQVYNHMIMPLASRRDTDHAGALGPGRLSRALRPRSRGHVAAGDGGGQRDLGASSPRRAFASRSWHPTRRAARDPLWAGPGGRSASSIDPSRAYRWTGPAGASLDLFFYDAPVSRAIAFENALRPGRHWPRASTARSMGTARGPSSSTAPPTVRATATIAASGRWGWRRRSS